MTYIHTHTTSNIFIQMKRFHNVSVFVRSVILHEHELVINKLIGYDIK
jgi:hypothetical protein